LDEKEDGYIITVKIGLDGFNKSVPFYQPTNENMPFVLPITWLGRFRLSPE
jgi:hypothetical protein